MVVVSDASALILLAKVGQLGLLKALYGHVLIPDQVFDDVVVKGNGRAGASEVQTAEWIEVRHATNEPLVEELQRELDRGEAEAIALAVELRADLLLLDERRGRMVASRYTVQIIGVAGALVEAKYRNLLSDLRPVLNALINNGYRISAQLYTQILRAAGEQT